MSKLESLEFRKEETERKIRLRPENPYLNLVKLIAYDAKGNEINSEEVNISSVKYEKHSRDNQDSGPFLPLKKSGNELLIQPTNEQDWSNVESIKVKLSIEKEFDYHKIVLYYKDFNLIESAY